ncbi:MAG: kinase/pyrophosphorylase [Rhodobacteraceae bacterium]|nr:kinase/pyrophosphorylase [Paracoccaceae bacterium]
MNSGKRKFFHLHLVSDATGETLNTVARAATANYADFQPIEHVYALVRSARQLQRVLRNVETNPGIVLFTIVDETLRKELEDSCRKLEVPAISILDPIISSLASYLNAESRPKTGAQHAMNAEYFHRIEAMNFTIMHDDGQHTHDLEKADVVIVGISRTSKTPTSIYLANRGLKTANVPLVPQVPLPETVETLTKPVVVGLVASPERISQIRRNRLLSLHEDRETSYVDKTVIAEEIAFARKLCHRHNWPVIDVTRRSIEETAAAILNIYHQRSQVEAER